MTEPQEVVTGGWIYAFANVGEPESYKIGKTQSIEKRLKDANGETFGHITPWTVVLAKRVTNPSKIEKEVHLLLNEFRIKKNREKFKISREQLNAAFDSIEGEYRVPVVERVYADPDCPWYITFSNGTYVSEENSPGFYSGEDMSPRLMGKYGSSKPIEYIPYDSASTEQITLKKFFTDIYPDDDMRHYMLTLLSSCLYGCNVEQKFYILRSKKPSLVSSLTTLISITFGEYLMKVPTKSLTDMFEESQSKELTGKHVGIAVTETSTKLNSAVIKFLTEGVVRCFLDVEKLPTVTAPERSILDRIVVIPNTTPTVPIRPDTSTLHKWRPYFASLLVHYYETSYLKYGLREPASVTEATVNYINNNDPEQKKEELTEFSKECLVREVGAEVKVRDVIVMYKQWVKQNPGHKILQKSVIIQNMAKIYGALIDAAGKVFKGVRLIIEDENEDLPAV